MSNIFNDTFFTTISSRAFRKTKQNPTNKSLGEKATTISSKAFVEGVQ